MDPVERYLGELRDLHLSGAGVAETSGYPALKELLDAVGKRLKPKVRCLIHLNNQGEGIPDGGLFTADQFPRGGEAPKEGQVPAVGAMEVKPVDHDLAALTGSRQVLGYLQRYGQVLVTNYREFALVVRTRGGGARRTDGFSLSATAEEFWSLAGHPRKAADERGARLVEFLTRVLRSRAVLTEPADVAWFLASHARDAMEAVGHHDIPALDAVRAAMQEALGIEFKGDKGDHFFRSSLIQTLFYGIFSGWVLWSREHPPGDETPFDWRQASWHLKVPMIDALFAQIAQPGPIEELGLRAILDRTAEVLNRVDRAVFFQRFQAAEAVQYFYEPFLEAFDPALRKELGVWYTPREVVQYMVARVDAVLKSELGLARGLADPSVYVLDPCCGTGAYLVEVLERIAGTLKEEGGGALVASDLRKAARERVFGFELLPAPFVVSHLQLGLLLQRLGAPLGGSRGDRAGVFLTNSLTGWAEEPPHGMSPFPSMEQERQLASDVKRNKPILVVLGNPPYNAFAGTESEDEQGSVEPYKKGLHSRWGIKKYNLDDLYVRFFRLAERRISEMSGRGVVSFISPSSWLQDPSFVVMREHLLGSFDHFWIEDMHGDRTISEYAPDGSTSETVFAIQGVSAGIQQGIAISLWSKRGRGTETPKVWFRSDLNQGKASSRRQALLQSLADPDLGSRYVAVSPSRDNRFSFRPSVVSHEYLLWPQVPVFGAIAPTNGLMEKRGGALFDIDREELARRMRRYFDTSLDWESYKAGTRHLVRDMARFRARESRSKVLSAEGFVEERIQRYALRPFDIRWAYYSPVRPLWNEPRPSYTAHVWSGNRFLVSRPAAVAAPEGLPLWGVSTLGDNDALRGHAYFFPLYLRRSALQAQELFSVPSGTDFIPNLSLRAKDYLKRLGLKSNEASVSPLIWEHSIAIGASQGYLHEHADGVARDWPRIPLPATREALEASAALGRQLADLLDPEITVPGVSTGPLRTDLRPLGALSTTDKQPIDPEQGDLALTAGWGNAGKNGVTMPGKGKVVTRPDGALDVYLNERVYWTNVPVAVWEYTLGGYQVIKKWLSYRERRVLGRDLKDDEARYVSEMVRRIAAILALGPELDANYERVKADTYPWPAG